MSSGATALVQVTPPYGALTFNELQAIALPSPASGENVMFTFPVPLGYDGIITGQNNGYIGNGFVEGSGDIVWRIAVYNATGAQRYLKDCGAILFTLGQLKNYQTVPGGIRLYSQNLVTIVVTCPNTSGSLPPPGTGQVFAGLHGWMWPR